MMDFNSWMNAGYVPWHGGISPFLGFGIFGISLLLVWSLVWKAFALWHSARDGSKIWFVALCLINTLGILEILYIFVFRKRTPDAVSDTRLQ